MENFQVKELSIDDYDQIIRLWADSGLPYKPYGRDSRQMVMLEMERANCSYWGISDSDHLIACGIANFDGRRGWINRVAVHPDFRGKQLAFLVIESCEKFLYELGAVVICALIEDINYPSISCFQNVGYACEKDFLYFTKRKDPKD